MSNDNSEDEIIAAENLIEIIEEATEKKGHRLDKAEKIAGVTCRAAYLAIYAANNHYRGIPADTYRYIMYVLNDVLSEMAITRYNSSEAISIMNEGQISILANKIDLLQTMKEVAHAEAEDFYPETEFKLDVDKAIMGLVEARLEAKGHHLNAYEVSNMLEYIDTLENRIAELEKNSMK